MAGIFDIFTNANAQAAANDQIAGINSGLTSATNAINTGSQDLTSYYTSALQPFMQNYNVGSTGQNQYASALGLNGGPAGAAAAASAYASNPAYQFQLNQGNQNVLRNSAQTGTTASGATLAALQAQGQGQANSTYQQYVQNLQPFLGTAATAASGAGAVNTGLGSALNANQGSLANLNWTAATGIGNANANAQLANNQADANIWGAIGQGAGLAVQGAALLSDARWKEDIKPVGELHDGQPVYSYRYVFDDPGMTRIGLMAQDVEKTNPDAVIDAGGVKLVDYGRATKFAAELARFADAPADNVVPFKSREAASPVDVFARFLEGGVMVSFSDPVAVPPTSAYGPPAVDFSWLANLPNQYFKAKQNQFQDQQNQQTTQQQQAFKNGIPLDANGNPDYRAITQMLAQKGDINAISQLAPYVQFQGASTQASQPDPMLANLPGGGQQPQSAAAPQPQKTPATQQGGDQAGSIVDVVTAKIPQEQAGPTIARIAQVTGIDPNAALTPGQQVRVNGLVQRYAQPAASPQSSPQGQPAPAAAPAVQPARARVDSGFSAFPPSAGNVSPAATPPQRPAPQPGQQPQPAAQPRPQPPAPQVAPQARPPAPAPQQQQQPLVPQVPLPQGYSDPQQAILALNREASLIARNKPDQANMLKDWATRIEASIKPFPVHAGETLLNPATSQPIYQGASSNPTAIALQRYLAENPSATPEQIQQFVQAGRGGARSAVGMYMQKYLSENPDASADDVKRAAQLYTTQTTAQNRFLSGPQGNTIRSLNVVVSHIQTMQDLGNALDNGNVKAFNAVAQRWAEETGDPAPTNFDTAKQIVGAEVIKALGVAGAGSQAERQEAADAFNRARSPAQLAGAISAVRKLMVGQLSGLRRQFVAASGLPGDKFDEMLEPETKSFFGQSERGADSAAPAAKNNAGGNVVQWVRKPDGNLGPAQ